MVRKDEFSRRRFLRALGGGVVLIGGGSLAGCGGGVIGQGDRPPGDGTPSGGNNGGGTPGTPLTSAQRIAAMDAVNARARAIFSNDLPAMNRQMLTFLQARPEFSRVGLSDDGVVWGRFTDGSLYYFINNRLPGPAAGADTALLRSRAVNSDVPRSTSVFLLNGLGTYLPSPAADLRGWLLANGYTQGLSPASDATLDALRGVRGAGVLYFSTHGGEGDGGFGLTTTTRVVDALDNSASIRQEVKDNLLIYASVPLDKPGLFDDPEYVRVYGITYKFIEKYWTFAANSLCYIDACSSDELLIKDKCYKNGVSLYAGWTAPVTNGAANNAARFAFDRMLGSNTTDPREDPEQRPFDYDSVWADMKSRGLDTSQSASYGAAKLIFSLNGRNPDYGVLAPSIKFMDVEEEEDELILHGLFGQLRGIVRVGTTDLAIKTWEKEKIVCTLPRTGPGASGPVTVIVSNHKSNVRNLTEWRGDFRYQLDDEGSLQIDMTFKCHFRADIQEYREKPHEAPKSRIVRIMGAMDSQGSYRIGGTASEDDLTVVWSGEGLLPYAKLSDGTTPNRLMRFFGYLDPKQKKMTLLLSGGVLTPTAWTTELIRPRDRQTFTNACVPDTRAYHRIASPAAGVPLMPQLDVTFDSGFGINSLRRNVAVDSFGLSEGTATLRWQWDAIPANHPPDPDGTR